MTSMRTITVYTVTSIPGVTGWHLDILPTAEAGDSHPHEWAFLFHRVLPVRAFARPGLTDSPQAATASPAANTFLAALISRSWSTPHSGQTQCRISRERESRICPQS